MRNRHTATCATTCAVRAKPHGAGAETTVAATTAYALCQDAMAADVLGLNRGSRSCRHADQFAIAPNRRATRSGKEASGTPGITTIATQTLSEYAMTAFAIGYGTPMMSHINCTAVPPGQRTAAFTYNPPTVASAAARTANTLRKNPVSIVAGGSNQASSAVGDTDSTTGGGCPSRSATGPEVPVTARTAGPGPTLDKYPVRPVATGRDC